MDEIDNDKIFLSLQGSSAIKQIWGFIKTKEKVVVHSFDWCSFLEEHFNFKHLYRYRWI